MALEKSVSLFTIVMISAKLVMAQFQATVLHAMKHLFWMKTNASVMKTNILILLTQRIVTKALAKNVLIIIEMARDYKLFVLNVISNGYFSFTSLKF